jgi:hypothetical protein
MIGIALAAMSGRAISTSLDLMFEPNAASSPAPAKKG